MSRRAVAAALSALALAGCGPDCVAYCDKLDTCARTAAPPVAFDRAQCRADCDAMGGSRGATIDCVIDHACADLLSGKECSPTGQAPWF